MNTTDPHPNRERGPTPVTRAVRGIRDRLRKRRSGVAVIVQVLMYAALVAVIIAGAIGGPALYRRIVGGGEQNALKTNIDQVARIAEEYWTQYAADIGGRRDIDLTELCPYLNRELAGSAIALRTVAVHADLGSMAEAQPANAHDGAAWGATAAATGIREGTAARININSTPVNATAALCPTVHQGRTIWSAQGGRNPDPTASPPAGRGVDLRIGHAGGNAVSTGELATAGLRSTRTVWMAQYNMATGTNVPAGARATQGAGNDVLVFGGVAPDGTSYCLIKVFSANQRAAVGEYRVARVPLGDRFAVCSEGIAAGAGNPNQPRVNAGWPEPS